MRKALDLARSAIDPRPNPYVGALLVKNGRIISSGFHKKTGSHHAEISCLNKAKNKIKNATLYVTLEPCIHFGYTPPCVNKIIETGIKHVVVGVMDANPKNRGRGIKLMRQNGIKVEVGFLENELNEINAAFIKYITKKMPYVCIKAGQSIDGKIATRVFDSKWITGSAAREFSRKLRNDFDAIMVGANTVVKDNPMLAGTSKNLKIAVDTHLKIPLAAKLFSEGKTIIITGDKIPRRKSAALIRRGVCIIKGKLKNSRIDLRVMMKKIAGLGISKILVEGGGELIGSLFDEKLVDKTMFFISPKIIGGRGAVSSIMGKGVRRIKEAVSLRDVKTRRIGEDFLIEGSVNVYGDN